MRRANGKGEWGKVRGSYLRPDLVVSASASVHMDWRLLRMLLKPGARIPCGLYVDDHSQSTDYSTTLIARDWGESYWLDVAPRMEIATLPSPSSPSCSGAVASPL